ncbi:hypothetical protein [Phenylobacterium sp.]|jgi:hypothetical protein|uniref:phage adaptor protein n=1 Tax=Phenylobacterium sp. TaxID=1871053 RepID=UPI0037CC7750
MAISTYAELQAAAAGWLVRGDLTARIPEFIALAEARLNRILRTRLSETEATLHVAGGAMSAPLPAGFTEPLRLWVVRPEGREELPFVEAARQRAWTARGEPSAWSVDGQAVTFDRPCAAPTTLVLRMLRAFSLSAVAPTNALLDEAPDIYLFATLCEAGPFLRDGELAQAYEAKLQRAVAELNAKAARSRAASRLVTDLPELAGAC